MGDKILITGASGCVGSSLVKRLVEQGHDVRCLDLSNTWHPFLDNLSFEMVRGSITNIKDVEKAVKGCDYVYQVAGFVSYNVNDHKKMYDVHVNGVRNVLQAAKKYGVKKVVVTGSTAGIGIPKNKNLPLNEDAPFDFEKYRKVMYMYSKYISMEDCKKFSKEGLHVSIVSPTTIYGQGDITMHIGNTVKKINEGMLNVAPPGGNAVVSIDDVVDAHLLVMKKGKSGENYVFADEFIPYQEMFNRIAILLNKPPITRVSSKWILPFTKAYLSVVEKTMLFFNKNPKQSPHSVNFKFKYRYFDSTKARKELGWKPKVSFDEAMQKAIDFYKEQHLL